MRLVVVSHALVQEGARARWRRLAERHPVSVSLLVPAYWPTEWFGSRQVWRPQAERSEGFQVLPIPTTAPGNWYRYLFRSVDAHLRELRPDLIYVVQEELTFVLQQMLLYRDLWARSSRVVFFSWNNLGVPLGNWRTRLGWRRVRRSVDAAIAGNMQVERVLRGAGFDRPITQQTEIGFDERQFHPDAVSRASARARLGLRGFVVGFAGRLVAEKGILDLAAALQGLEGDWSALVVGDGELRTELQRLAAEDGWGDRLVLVGEVDLDRMPEHIRAMDCLVLPSRTTPKWVEQFGLVLAQAMACGVPVVGSSSGAIPEVIGDSGSIFPEGDPLALRGLLRTLRDDASIRDRLAQRGLERALSRFSATGLADATFDHFSALLGSPT